jgi:hypothetical protein
MDVLYYFVTDLSSHWQDDSDSENPFPDPVEEESSLPLTDETRA